MLNNVGRVKPLWKVLPHEESDWTMHNIRRALGGDPVHGVRSIELEGHKINAKIRMFDLGKGLVVCLARHELDGHAGSIAPPTEFDALSRYYLLKQRLDLSDPEVVWWVQEMGFITNHRYRLDMTPPFAISPGRLIHLGEICHPDSAQRIMSYVPEVLGTRHQQSFTLEESLENLRIVNVYTLYPLTTVWSIERAVAMVTKSCIFSTTLDPRKVYPVGWEATDVS